MAGVAGSLVSISAGVFAAAVTMDPDEGATFIAIWFWLAGPPVSAVAMAADPRREALVWMTQIFTRGNIRESSLRVAEQARGRTCRMSDEIYTLGAWRVKEGKQTEFVDAWKALGHHFRSLPHPPGEGTLVQSVDDPQQFYSFGPWRSLDDIQEMRSHPETPSEIGKLMDLCEEGRPGAYRVVATG